MRNVKEIKSITAAIGNWYRVKGTRSRPTFERIVTWAVVSAVEVPGGNEDEYVWTDIIVGVPASHIGSQGLDVDDLITDVAGYVELNDDELIKVSANPLHLPHENLVWED